MNRKPARSAVEAWKRWHEMAGFELEGRDRGLEDALRKFLCESAPTLDDALRGCSTAKLVSYLLEKEVQPCVAMFRDILAFFKAAGVREGREQWRVQLDEEFVELRAFQEFLETWEEVDCEFDVRAIDFGGAFSVTKAVCKVEGGSDLLDEGRKTGYRTGIEDVDAWIRAYDGNSYLPLPASLSPKVLPELADAVALINACLSITRASWPDRKTMQDEHRARGYRCDREDGLHPTTIAQNETDHCLRNSIYCLARLRSMSDAERKSFAERVASNLSRYPRRKTSLSAPQSRLETILSLPVWRKRHELYSVWIATEIVAALQDHDCCIHSEDGKIVFAFRKTLLATVETCRPKVHLYSERRSPLNDPAGHGRVANVQPDFTLWRSLGSAEACGLVIEVKHYLRSSPSRFSDVLRDYARAHRSARIVLVNHGPGYNHSDTVIAGIAKRCTVIGELTPFHPKQRDELKSLVREYVGDPHVDSAASPSPTRVLAVDTSGSMESALASPEFAGLLASVAASADDVVALVDCTIRTRCRLDEFTKVCSSIGGGDGAELRGPILALLREVESVLLFTDGDGVRSLGTLDIDVLKVQLFGTDMVEVVEIRR